MAGETEAEEGESEKYSRIGCGGLDWREQPSGRRREGAPHSISAAAARGGVSSLTQLDAWDRVVKERSGGARQVKLVRCILIPIIYLVNKIIKIFSFNFLVCSRHG
jgi:hypothetical protein